LTKLYFTVNDRGKHNFPNITQISEEEVASETQKASEKTGSFKIIVVWASL